MKVVYAYYLRKPLYILLQHAKGKIAECSTYIEEDSEENILPLFKTEDKFRVLADISFDRIFRVKEQRTSVWRDIQNYWIDKAGEKDKRNFQDSFKGKVTKKSTLHTELHVKIDEWDENTNSSKDERTIINNTPTVTTKFALATCYLANCAANSLNDEILQAEIGRIIKQIEEEESLDISAEQEHSRIINDHEKFWLTGESMGKKIPDVFLNSNFICYERTDGIANYHGQWGVALSSIRIGEPDLDGYTPISVLSTYVSGSFYHKGVITLDADSVHLVAHLMRENGHLRTPAFFVMRLNFSNPESHELVVGHFMYYSIYYRRYLAKTVVWLQTENEISPQDFANTNPEFKEKVPQLIRSFLHNRLRNRLTMPSTYLTNLSTNKKYQGDSLEKWLQEKNGAITNDAILKAAQGSYFIIYYHGPTSHSTKRDDLSIANCLRVDELKIEYKEDSAEYEATYLHKRNARQKKDSNNNVNSPKMEKTMYKGFARRRRSTIQIILNELPLVPIHDTISIADSIVNRTAQANYVHITFCTPSVQSVALAEFERQDFFQGIVGGCNDANYDPVSFRALILSQGNLINSDEFTEDYEFIPADNLELPIMRRICQYFRNHIRTCSILVHNQPIRLVDQYPSLEELRKAGGSYSIEAIKSSYTIKCTYQDKAYTQSGSDIHLLLKKADEQVLMWLASNKTNGQSSSA